MNLLGKIVDVNYRELHWRLTDELRPDDLITYYNSLYVIKEIYHNKTTKKDTLVIMPISNDPRMRNIGYPEITFDDEFLVRTVKLNCEDEHYLLLPNDDNNYLEDGEDVELGSYGLTRYVVNKISWKNKLEALLDEI